MLEILDVNNYGLQSMVATGGGKSEDLTEELNAQDTKISAQTTKIAQLEQALNNKITLDLTNATSDATATAGDIKSGKTAYVSGEKIVGEAEGAIPDWTELGYEGAPQSVIDDYNYSKNIKDNWDSSVTNLYGKYSSNQNIVYMPVVDTSNVTSMSSMFNYAKSFKYFPALDTRKVTDMSGMFSQCENLSKVEHFNTSKVTNMSNMFYACRKLKTIEPFETKQATEISSLFYDCQSLSEIFDLDLSNATSISEIVRACPIRTIKLLNTSKVSNMQYAFYTCRKLESIDLFDTSNVRTMMDAFGYCTVLKDVPQFNTQKITANSYGGNTMYKMFESCPALSDESLNNILLMCINSGIKSSSEKILKNVGLTSEQATKCQTLPAWNDFVAAGWTTGY